MNFLRSGGGLFSSSSPRGAAPDHLCFGKFCERGLNVISGGSRISYGLDPALVGTVYIDFTDFKVKRAGTKLLFYIHYDSYWCLHIYVMMKQIMTQQIFRELPRRNASQKTKHKDTD